MPPDRLPRIYITDVVARWLDREVSKIVGELGRVPGKAEIHAAMLEVARVHHDEVIAKLRRQDS